MTLYIIHGWTYTTEPWNGTIAALKKAGINVKMLNVPGLTSPIRESLDGGGIRQMGRRKYS